MTLEITQGATRIIVAKHLRDARGQLLDPTGWAIHAVLRKDAVTGVLVATWRDTPGVGEGLAEVVDADPDLDPDVAPGEKWIYHHIPHAMSSAWVICRGVFQSEITEPGTDRRERIIDEYDVRLDPEAVTS